jgi:sigma-B regulation protein RsbU (phosphoserine phosphatase)
VVADPDLTEAEVVLRPGDALVLYTDGVTEARNPAGLFGEDRLLDVLGAAAGRTADAIAGALDEAVRAHRAGSDDDLAILVIQVARR